MRKPSPGFKFHFEVNCFSPFPLKKWNTSVSSPWNMKVSEFVVISYLYAMSLAFLNLPWLKTFAEHCCCCQPGLSLHPTATPARRGPGLTWQVRGPSGGEEARLTPREPQRRRRRAQASPPELREPSRGAQRAPGPRPAAAGGARPPGLRLSAAGLINKPRPHSPAPAGFAAARGFASPARPRRPAEGGRGGWRAGARAGDRGVGGGGERSEEAGGRAPGGGGARGGAGARRRGGGRGGGGARPSRSRGAATPPSLLKTLPLKWGRVFQLKKRSIFFFSKKADEVGKKGKRNRHRLCSGNRSSNCLSEKRSKEGREGGE